MMLYIHHELHYFKSIIYMNHSGELSRYQFYILYILRIPNYFIIIKVICSYILYVVIEIVIL